MWANVGVSMAAERRCNSYTCYDTYRRISLRMITAVYEYDERQTAQEDEEMAQASDLCSRRQQVRILAGQPATITEISHI
jgi:hypothetical protein